MSVDLASLVLRVESLEVENATKRLGDFSAAGGRAERSANSFSGASGLLAKALGAVTAAISVQQLVTLADSYLRIEGRLKLVTKSTYELASVQKDLYAASQRSMSSYVDTANVFNRFAQATKGTGTSMGELVTMTETLNKAFTVSGASGAEAQGAMVQLSQAFSSGVLRGEEFNSVAENGGRIMDMLAEYTGRSRGELRKMAESGALTADVLKGALLQGAAKVNDEFKKMPVTVEKAGTEFMNVMGQLVNDANRASGATESIASAISGLAKTIDENRSGIITFFQNMAKGAKESQSGAEMMAEAAGATINKTAEVVTASQKLQREVDAINARMEKYRQNKNISPENMAAFLQEDSAKISELNGKIKELTRSTIVTGEAGGKSWNYYASAAYLAGQKTEGVAFQMQGVKVQSESMMKITEKESKAFESYTETKAQAIEREYTLALRGAKNDADIQLVKAKRQEEYDKIGEEIEKKREAASNKAETEREKAERERTRASREAIDTATRRLTAEHELLVAQGLGYEAALKQVEIDELSKRTRGEGNEEINKQTRELKELTLAKQEEMRIAQSAQSIAEMNGEWEKARIIQLAIMDIQIAMAGKDVEKIAILKRQREELEKLSDSWTAYGKGFEDTVKEWRDTGKQMAQIGADTARAMQQSFSDYFFDAMTGKMKSLADYFKSFMASIQRSIANAMSQQVVSGMGIGAVMGTAGTAAASDSGTSGFALGSLLGSGSGLGISDGLVSTLSDWTVSLEAADFVGLSGAMGGLEDAVLGLQSTFGVGLADGILAGAGSLAMSLLMGQGLTIQTGLQAAGAAIGSLGGPVGAMIGGFVGNMIGGMFGDNGADTFRATPLAANLGANYDREKGMVNTGYQFTGGDTDSKIYAAMTPSIVALQEGFDKQVDALVKNIPEVMSNQILDSLSQVDFKSKFIEIGSGEWEVGNADAALKEMLTAYATFMAKSLGDSYANALSSYIDEKGAAGLVGDNAVWALLTEKVKSNIETAFTGAAAAIKGGDIDGGVSTISNIATAIAQIGAAMKPIQEIIDTNGLDEYELSIRSINLQFDAYSSVLKAAGVDMEKYTKLEEARAIALDKVAEKQRELAQTDLTTTTEKVTSLIASIASQVQTLADSANESALALEEAKGAISAALWSAQDEQISAQEEVNNLIKQAAENLRTFTATIDSFLNTIDPTKASGASLNSLKTQLQVTSSAAAGGDKDAQGQLLSQAQSVLDKAKSTSRSATEESRVEAFVRQQLLMVKSAVNYNASGVTGEAEVVVDPMEAAQEKLDAATAKVDGLIALAELAGANTDRSLVVAADSLSALTTSYNDAVAANIQAQSQYDIALLLTKGITFDTSTAMGDLFENLKLLPPANQAWIDSAAAAILVTDGAAITLADSLGLVGTERTTFLEGMGDVGKASGFLASALGVSTTDPLGLAYKLDISGDAAKSLTDELINTETAGRTLATLLGLDGTDPTSLAYKIGLTGSAAIAFAEKIGTYDLSTLADPFITAFGLTGTAADNLTTLLNGDITTSIGLVGTAAGSLATLIDGNVTTSVGNFSTAANTIATLLGVNETDPAGLAYRIGLTGAAAIAFAGKIETYDLSTLAAPFNTAFGLTGTAASSLTGLISGDVTTAANTVATLLGVSGTDPAGLAYKIGLTGTAATDFATKIRDYDLSPLAVPFNTAFGLTGTAADNLTGLINGQVSENVGSFSTAAGTVARLLGVSGTDPLGLAYKIGLTGTAATDFATKINTYDLSTLADPFNTAFGLTGTAAGKLTALLNGDVTTAANTMAALLGVSGTDPEGLAYKIGLTGSAAIAFANKIGTTDLSMLATPFNTAFGLTGTAASNLTLLINGSITDSVKLTGEAAGRLTSLLSGSVANSVDGFSTAAGVVAGLLGISPYDPMGLAYKIGLTGAAAIEFATSVGAINLTPVIDKFTKTDTGTILHAADTLGTALGQTGTALGTFVSAVNALQFDRSSSSIEDPTTAIIKSLYASNPTATAYNPNGPDAGAISYWKDRIANEGLSAIIEGAFNTEVANYASSHPLPRYATGTNSVGSDGPAYLHAGEQVKPRAYVDSEKAERGETNNILKEMKAELVAQKQENKAMAVNLKRMADILANITRGGNAMITVAA